MRRALGGERPRAASEPPAVRGGSGARGPARHDAPSCAPGRRPGLAGGAGPGPGPRVHGPRLARGGRPRGRLLLRSRDGRTARRRARAAARGDGARHGADGFPGGPPPGRGGGKPGRGRRAPRRVGTPRAPAARRVRVPPPLVRRPGSGPGGCDRGRVRARRRAESAGPRRPPTSRSRGGRRRPRAPRRPRRGAPRRRGVEPVTDGAHGPRFVITSLPRSGSTTLARILDCHPDVRCLVEPFHPSRYQGTFHRMAMDDGDVTPALERIGSRWNGIKHVWESSGWPFLGRPELNDRILSRPGLRVVVLVRRNWLRRVVSNLICRQTQFWIGTREEFCSRLERVRLRPLDPGAVLRQIRQDQEAGRRCLESLASQRAEVLSLYQEDLFPAGAGRSERLSLLNSILGFLGFATVGDSAFG